MRDPDGWTYFKEEVGGLVVGGFEPEAKPWRSPDTIPHPFEFQLLEEDWEHFSVLMDEALRRVPALGDTGIRKFYNGPESFTPDNQFVMGEAPGCAATSSAPGSTRSASPRPAAPAGRWRSGSSRGSRRPTWWPSTSAGSRSSTATTGGCRTGSPRCSACTTPCRGRTARWRPPGRSAARPCTTGWPPPARRSARRWAGSGRTSSRRTVESAELELLVGQAVLAAVVGGRAPGHPRGGRGVRPDVVLQVRRGRPGRARGAPVGLRERRRRRRRAGGLHAAAEPPRRLRVRPDGHPDRASRSSCWSAARRPRSATSTGSAGTSRTGCDARVRDVTTAYSVLGVMGPRSRDLLQRAHRRRPRRGGVPVRDQPDASRSASATVRATRMTYVGELGWELMVPVEFAAGVHDLLLREGRVRGRRERRLLRDRLAAAGEGLPRVRARPHPRLHAGRGGAGLRHGAQGRQAVPRARGAGGAPRPAARRAARGAGWCRSCSRTPTRCCGAASWCCATASRRAR